jgi:hypothetical protein
MDGVCTALRLRNSTYGLRYDRDPAAAGGRESTLAGDEIAFARLGEKSTNGHTIKKSPGKAAIQNRDDAR